MLETIKAIVQIIVSIQIIYYILKYNRNNNLEDAIWAILLLGVLNL